MASKTSVARRHTYLNTLKQIHKYSVELSDEVSIAKIDVYLTKLDYIWDGFVDTEASLPVGIDSISEEFNDLYFDAKSLLQEHKSRLCPQQSTLTNESDSQSQKALQRLLEQQRTFMEALSNKQNESHIDLTALSQTLPNSESAVKLPKINIEPFDGNYNNWPNFFDLYNSTVHSKPNLADVCKFQILKGLLRGHAAELLEGMNITDDNYKLAYEKLKDRYDKKRQILASMISSFLTQPAAVDGNVVNLRHLTDFSSKTLNSIKSLGTKAESRDPWLIQLLLQKVDTDTQEAWSLKMVENEFPSVEELLKFLSIRCDAKEGVISVSGKKQPKQMSTVKSYHTSENQTSIVCPNCNYGHLLSRCRKFRSLPVVTRRKLVNEFQVCYNCLKKGHSSSDCNSELRCRNCQQKHHNLLHYDTKSSTFTAVTNNQELTASSSETTQPISSKSQQNTQSEIAFHTNVTQFRSVNKNSIGNFVTETEATASRTVGFENLHTQSFVLPQNSDNNKAHSRVTQNIFYDAQCLNAIISIQTILPTALVYINDAYGQKQLVRVLLDSASSASFISESLVQRLRIRRTYCNRTITGISNTPAGSSKGYVNVTLQSRFNEINSLNINALILNKISSIVPASQLTSPVFEGESFKSIDLADPRFFVPAKIDVLLGAERVFNCLSGEQCQFSSNLFGLSTMFGWVIGGEVNRLNIQSHCTMVATQDDLNVTLQRFWKLEEVPATVQHSTSVVEDHYVKNVKQMNDGRYMVKLPIIDDNKVLGNSKKAAVMRLFAMERRFERNEQLKTQYVDFMSEYLQMQHMSEIPADEVNSNDSASYYLPHHAVLKNDSSTTKLRVVFDGSCASSSGISINDKLRNGPTIQDDLFLILARFRKFPIAYAADIEKMYRQVLVYPEDREFQRIVWRNHRSDEIKAYRLNTVTYGTTSAPFLAIRTLKQIAYDCPRANQTTREKIINDFYVDDLLSGSENIESAIEEVQDITQCLKFGQFNIRKWRSNSSQLLSTIPEDCKEVNELQVTEESLTVKTLGLYWNPVRDVFRFKINVSSDTTAVSKRQFLSEIAKIFDPLGWLSPVTVTLKIMFQQLWTEHIDWDDELSTEFKTNWFKHRSTLAELESISIPRYYMFTNNHPNVELHAFCDASESAYGAVLYFRTISKKDEINIRIIAAKTRVAPLKKITMPRLELSGAVLLTNFVKYIQQHMQIENMSVHAWCDSQIVLAWLASAPHKWKPFIANRTSQILEVLPRSSWRYVKSKDNPADAASRGLSPNDLKKSDLWWQGPPWLKLHKVDWPTYTVDVCPSSINCELRKSNVTTNICFTPNDTINWILNQWSSFGKIKRIIASILLISPAFKSIHLVDRLRTAEKICIHYVQQQEFHEEIHDLKNGKTIRSKSKLRSLTPFLDPDSILRVGGRLQCSNLMYDQKHPMILPKGHILSQLIVNETHLIHCHAGPSLLTSILRQKYWIIDCKNMSRCIVNKCLNCFRYKNFNTSQLMGNLPANRVTPSRPFMLTGVDYAGPVKIKARPGRGNIPIIKGYIALFICLSTKATHIEMVSDLTTDAYIAALRRFIARRGVPAEIHSDNGSNFVGAQNEIKRQLKLFQNHNNFFKISSSLAQHDIKFKFIPARAPHFGGIWESNIKSMKSHINRVTNDAILTFEEMSTLLTQIEALLNSRPLCPVTDDPHDLNVLTPGHFLIGAPITSIPEPDYKDVPMNRLSRWQNIQCRVQSFWRKWSLEYLHTMQQRNKWQSEESNIQKGELVLVKNDNQPPSQWILARIINVHPGNDGLIRVATIKTEAGELVRPIVKLCRLPTDVQPTSSINKFPSDVNLRCLNPNTEHKPSDV